MELDRGETRWKRISLGEKKIKYGPGNCEDIIGIKGYKAKGQIISYLADDSRGILPHGIVNGSIIFVDTKASYKEGDLIIIKDLRNKKDGVRIARAISKKKRISWEEYF